MNILQIVKQALDEKPDFNGDYHSAFYDYATDLEDLPKVRVEVDEDEYEEEDLDFENFSIVTASKDEIVFCAGGDWQEPLIITLKVNEAGEVYVAEHKEGFHPDGMHDEEFNKLISEA